MQLIMMHNSDMSLPAFFPVQYPEETAQGMAMRLKDIIYFFADVSTDGPDCPRNPYMPEAPEDGKHFFGSNSYRCVLCGVYDRPDVESTREVLEAPCLGNWAHSGKMRVWAEDKWKAEQQAASEGLTST